MVIGEGSFLSRSLGPATVDYRFRIEPSLLSNQAKLHLGGPKLQSEITYSDVNSDRSLIAAQSDRCGEECRGDCQPDPQARAAQVVTRIKVCHRIHRELARRCESLHATA